MTLHSSLLALVLLVLCGGLEPAWTVVPTDDATECPVAPEAPAEAESESGGEEAIVSTGIETGTFRAAGLSRGGAQAASAEDAVRTPPPRS